jgi:hypothetical protein
VIANALRTARSLLRPPRGPRSLRVFDADRLAELETEMWRVYYRKQKARLFGLLLVLLREQYRLPLGHALRVGFHWARAAAIFGDARGDYDRVLPDLERGYRIVKDWTRSGFDERSVAKAELAWWVARRVPAESSPENVGRLIGELYAQVYDAPVERVVEAGVLRAKAGWIRDQAGERADWGEVAELLLRSFRSLRAGVA